MYKYIPENMTRNNINKASTPASLQRVLANGLKKYRTVVNNSENDENNNNEMSLSE